MENKLINNKFRWAYLTGFLIILALPILTLPPWFYPPDWPKTIIFRSIMAAVLFLFIFQLLYKKNEISLPNIKNSKTIWTLATLFIVFLLASIFSVDPYFSFWASPYRGGGFITFGFYFIFAILAFILFKKNDPSTGSGLSWKKAWILSISAGILVSLIALIQFYGLFRNIFVFEANRPGSTIGNPIFLGIYLSLLFFPTLSFLIKESFGTAQDKKNKYLKIFYIFSLLIFLYTILITESRAAYLGIVAGVLYFLLFYPVRKTEQSRVSDSSKKDLAKRNSGNPPSDGVYPKKLKSLKICLGLFLIFIFLIVFYVNIHPQLPKILQNGIAQKIANRLSIKALYTEERFKAWQIVIKEIKDKPILGYGLENLAVGFDKNYDPLITPSPWWDKAHNVFLDIGAQTGILGILAYLTLFVVLFCQLHKAKRTELHRTEHENTQIIIHGIQATLIGYLVANFFSFDTFATYLIFFFIIGYSLHLISLNDAETRRNFTRNDAEQKNNLWKSVFIFVLFCVLILFLWQYNLVPFQINTQINIANNLTDQKKCDRSLALMEKISQNHSFIDSFLRMEYVSNIKTCAGYYPDNGLVYAKKGVELLNEGLKIQPLYTRYWIYLGSFTTVIANNEQAPAIKENLVKEANSYFDKAETLSPLHTEIFIERAKTDMVAGNYQKMEQNAQECIAINPNLGDCYWTKALAKMYQKKYDEANKNIETAKKYGFNESNIIALYQLIEVYNKNEQYKELVAVYEKLIVINTNMAQYRSSLAFAYSKIGEYKKARYQAMIFLQLMPEAKDEVDAFLRTLPY